jgi:hypothetical protein
MKFYSAIPTKTPKYFSLAALKTRGWNSNEIERFLRKHDSILEAFGNYSKVKLYLSERVLQAEQSPDYLKLKYEIKKKRILRDIQQMADTMSKTENFRSLVELSIDGYNKFRTVMEEHATKFDVSTATASIDSDPKFLDRITVNYIRHNLSNFDSIESCADYDVEIYNVLNKEIYNKIIQLYPQLEEECIRQMKSKNLI